MGLLTIQLDDATARSAVAAAQAKHISLDEYVRLAVAEKLAADLRAVADRADANLAKHAGIVRYLAEH